MPDVSYDKGNTDEVRGIIADLNSTHAEIDKSDQPVDRRCPTPTTEALYGIQATEQRKCKSVCCCLGKTLFDAQSSSTVFNYS